MHYDLIILGSIAVVSRVGVAAPRDALRHTNINISNIISIQKVFSHLLFIGLCYADSTCER